MARPETQYDAGFIQIDPEALDREWHAQARLAWEYGRREASARDAHAKAEANLDLVRAEVYLEVKMCPSDHGFPEGKQPTVEDVKAAVTVSKRFRAAQEIALDRKKELDEYAVAVRALEHKKRALEKLVDLEQMHYHSEPRAAEGSGRDGVRDAARQRAKAETRKPVKRRE